MLIATMPAQNLQISNPSHKYFFLKQSMTVTNFEGYSSAIIIVRRVEVLTRVMKAAKYGKYVMLWDHKLLASCVCWCEGEPLQPIHHMVWIKQIWDFLSLENKSFMYLQMSCLLKQWKSHLEIYFDMGKTKADLLVQTQF